MAETPGATPERAAVHDEVPGRRRTPARRGSGDALRSEIVEAASDLLAESGDVETVSLRAVARRVGIATTSIYLHFADIDQLILAVKVQRFSELGARLHGVLSTIGDDPVARVRAIGHTYVQFGMTNPGHYRVMFSASTRGKLIGSAGMGVGLDTFQLLLGEVAGALGLPADGTQTHLVATSLWSFVHGMVHLRTARPFFPWPDMAGMIDDTVDRILHVHRPV